MNDNDECTWFEKTVEYKFVLEAKRILNIDFLSPLAGSAERIGDAVIQDGAKSYIIEFKKELGSMESEYVKYIGGVAGYEATNEKLKEKNLHVLNAHYMVGGFLIGNDDLGLTINNYFSPKENLHELLGSKDLIQGEERQASDNQAKNERPEYTFNFFLHDSGFNAEQLNDYTETMSLHRETKKGGETGGGGSSNIRVICVSKNKKAVSMSLSYYLKYAKELKMDIEKKLELSKKLDANNSKKSIFKFKK